MNIVIAQTNIEAMMHGVSYFLLPLKRGTKLTAVYTDGTRETASVSKELAEKVRAFYRYANENAPYVECPTGFELVGAIQSKRPDDDYAERRDFESERAKGVSRGGINL